MDVSIANLTGTQMRTYSKPRQLARNFVYRWNDVPQRIKINSTWCPPSVTIEMSCYARQKNASVTDRLTLSRQNLVAKMYEGIQQVVLSSHA